MVRRRPLRDWSTTSRMRARFSGRQSGWNSTRRIHSTACCASAASLPEPRSVSSTRPVAGAGAEIRIEAQDLLLQPLAHLLVGDGLAVFDHAHARQQRGQQRRGTAASSRGTPSRRSAMPVVALVMLSKVEATSGTPPAASTPCTRADRPASWAGCPRISGGADRRGGLVDCGRIARHSRRGSGAAPPARPGHAVRFACRRAVSARGALLAFGLLLPDRARGWVWRRAPRAARRRASTGAGSPAQTLRPERADLLDFGQLRFQGDGFAEIRASG